MFGLFKRNKLEIWELNLLKNVINKLPFQYSGLLDQINDGLIKGVLLNKSDITGYVAFTYNSNVLKKYDRKNEPDYKLCNIQVFDSKTLSFLLYEIYVSSGTISGYSLNGSIKKNIDINKININGFSKKFIGDSDFQKIIHLLNDDEKMFLNASQVYSIFINEKEYFHVKDLEDGDFIGIDLDKKVYKITHNPLEVIELNENLTNVLRH